MSVLSILDALLEYATRLHPSLPIYLQPGYDAVTVQQIVPFALPSDVLDLYQWHNGITPPNADVWDFPLFYYHGFLSLEEAYQTYKELMQVNIDIGFEGYNSALFPIFTFMGEYYSVCWDPSSDDYGTIYFVYHGEGKVYENLFSMLAAIRECYDAGAYMIQGDKIVVDKPRVAAIKAAWNPCRKQPDGTILNYHP